MTVKEYNRSVDEYADAVYRFIRGDLRTMTEANDIVQDSFEKLWKHVAEIDYSVVKSWLLLNSLSCYDRHHQKRKKNDRHGRMLDEVELLTDSQYSDLNEILHEALERLPEQQKTAVMLRDYEGYSYKEIGDITGLSEAQVKINIYRGRLTLRSYIGKIESVI